jgi:uncharacterized protein YdeI (YjbR/CyaY-like superfamily)
MTNAPVARAVAEYSNARTNRRPGPLGGLERARRLGRARINCVPETERNGLPILRFDDVPAWEGWLEEHYEASNGVWLQIAKKGSGAAPTVTYAGALESAICFGWIDGQKAGFDDAYWLQRFTPRGPRSRWSQVNRDKATALIEQGRMRAPGRRAVELAQQDGRWDAAYEPQSAATVPDDLQRALDAHPEAQAFFDTLTGATRYAFTYRLHHVKTPAARARRIQNYIELLEAHRTLHDR